VKATIYVAFNAERQGGRVVIQDGWLGQTIVNGVIQSQILLPKLMLYGMTTLVNNLQWPEVVHETESLEVQSLWRK
jgi:hypothetical protein